ncbi:hypothetical protein SAMN06297144_1092 [Sphingomonas guangdongensis]|uniref:Uncharacterized protein n=1 Tax=Sphingomonas guangdongensis TaxID=1141890 RepID=A0A285QEZ1_9SPHN|nr:hypothetical protein [Sphingomonas guangdongensis]SOB80500.1 hypothetical protein SAMN06297144_1092 [Sphingomonas guangdongensis]
MSKARFSIIYDGPALTDHTMDVRELAPALLAIGEMFDAANVALNGDATDVRVNVRAHEPGCFSIDLDVVQSIIKQGIALLSGDQIAAALNLKELLVGAVGGFGGLIWFIRWMRGRQPDRIERLPAGMVRVTIDGESIDVPLKLLRLYQDIAVRSAVERVVEIPLQRSGVETVEFAEQGTITSRVERAESELYRAPAIEDQVIIDDIRRAAFSIVSLAFKEDNKWRLHDGQNQISAIIADEDFLGRVDRNLISFSKGDVLICEVRFRQKQTGKGLVTENIVERVLEHRPAPRQLEFLIDDGSANLQ